MVHMPDMEDEEQTMYVPEVGTVALNKETETHHALADGTVELLDTVKYRNILPGRNYTLHGMIVKKETGNPVSEEEDIKNLFRTIRRKCRAWI